MSLRYGQLFSIWIVWYGLQRFALDFLRFGNGDATVGAFTWNQVSGLAGSMLGLGLFMWYGRTQPVSSEERDAELVGVAEPRLTIGRLRPCDRAVYRADYMSRRFFFVYFVFTGPRPGTT